MTGEKTVKYLIYAAGTAFALFLFPFLLRLFAPFAAAFLIAALSQRMVRFLKRRLKISRAVSSAVIVTLIVAAVTGAAVLVSFQLFTQLKNLLTAFPDALSSFEAQLEAIGEKYSETHFSLPPAVSELADEAILQFSDYSKNLSRSVASYAIGAAKTLAAALPDILLFLTMFILGTFFFTKDYVLIINFFREIFSENIIRRAVAVKQTVTRAFSSYLKAQLILMLITALLVTVCLWIAGMSYPLVWGPVCGLVDALPFFGTAAVLVPWSAVSLMYGDTYSAAALLIIQALTFTVRQLSEPKIVSRQIGIHPILTLVSVYVGLKYFGIAGVIIAPIVTLIAVNFYVSYRVHGGSAPKAPL